ncbi:Bax inhibitor-1/YccA family protein [Leifsonia sp. TF02-11]|uniref:Bax inhibitor-1/YccA family protein n=1 Tax=Leifsonia sp. TF02-11 TaxID=2815212 RepID=UPI001AA190B7|nr:Bax inhibitor-1/YccA family protein [Leifsonia sp. TF02-11]MBO1740392.1 Bax inhibitor-1/YccA family protein [Leifsonia sp. TF02-11]
MALNNPAFSTNPAFQNNGQTATAVAPSAENLEQMYQAPSATSADTDRMTVEDTINKSAISFALLVAGAVVGWMVPGLYIPAAIVGFVLALVNIFKKKPSPALILSYAGVQGIFVGGISAVFESIYPGIVIQAVIGTLAVVGVTLALFASGKIRASAKATKIFLIAMFGYLAYSLINVILVWTGVTHSAFGLSSDVKLFGVPLGVVIGVLVVIMGAYSLVLDFDFIQRGVKNRAPRIYGWSGAFGIMVTVIWLYLEILRLLAISRN